jgi:hypothetical protein
MADAISRSAWVDSRQGSVSIIVGGALQRAGRDDLAGPF